MASFARSRIQGLVVGLVALAVLISDLALADREQDRETFRQGWAAAARGDQAATLAAIQALPDYPLTPYLEFELLRQRIDRVPEAVVEQFLARHRDWTFAGTLEVVWLRSLARRGDYPALLRHGRDSGDAEVRCHVARADLAAGRTDGLAERAEALWLLGRSQHSACDPLFAWWRRQGHLQPEVAWRRFHLALNANELGLARYLRRYLDSDQRHWADRWLAMQERIYPTLRDARSWHDHAQARLIVRAGTMRLARSEWQRADNLWPALRARFDWPEDDQRDIEREIALYRAVALDRRALEAIDALPTEARDQQLLEWRARAAMAHDQWDEVLASIQAMDLSEQAQARWRYWRGRALSERGRPEALLAFGSLSSDATYYGFLSALHLGQDLELCEEPLPVDAAVQRRLMRDAEFERALELYHVGLNGHARRTWLSVARRLSRTELEQAALLAAGEG